MSVFHAWPANGAARAATREGVATHEN